MENKVHDLVNLLISLSESGFSGKLEIEFNRGGVACVTQTTRLNLAKDGKLDAPAQAA